jgi:small subunit ribosomal protein S8
MNVLNDSISRIINAQQSNLLITKLFFSKKVINILKVLWSEGFIWGFSISKDKKTIKVFLRYYKGRPVIKKIKQISKPGRWVYVSSDFLLKYSFGTGFFIISSSIGVHSSFSLSKKKLGGEVICWVL